jgi:delta14-sterol reductase
VPSRQVDGYARGSDGQPLQYRLNGLQVALLCALAFGVAAAQLPSLGTFFARHFLECAAAACAYGLALTAFLFARGPFEARAVCAPKIAAHKKRLSPTQLQGLSEKLRDVFFGLEMNPRPPWLPWFDVKMWLYLAGAVMLQLNVLSLFLHHLALRAEQGLGAAPGAVVVTVALQWFVLEYLFFEEVHLFTYDLVDENVGFKLAWGCLCFYAFVYAIPVLPFVGANGAGGGAAAESVAVAVAAALIFLVGYAFTRGANLQKFVFKRWPSYPRALGLLPQRTIGGRVLASGFWGLARHCNYFGEILMAAALALPSLPAPLPWLYPLYYVLLLGARERDDDERCAAKYGAEWKRYRELVPWRIVPWLY